MGEVSATDFRSSPGIPYNYPGISARESLVCRKVEGSKPRPPSAMNSQAFLNVLPPPKTDELVLM